MKKTLAKILTSIFTCVLLLAPSTSTAFAASTGPQLGGTGYVDAYATAEDYTRLPLNGTRMENIRVVVKVLNGHFYSDVGGNVSVYMDRADSLWTNNSINCNIIGQTSLYTTNNKNFSQNVQVQGLGSTYSYNQTLTKTEASNFMNQTGIEISVPEIGKITTSSQLNSAYSTSTTRSVTVTMNSNFTMWYSIQTTVQGIGSIYVTSN